MKYPILTTIFFTTYSIIAMDDTSKTRTGCISDTDRNKLSVTLCNKSGILLYAQIGDIERDEIRSCMPLKKDTKYLLFPYSRSFYRKNEYPKNGPAIKIFMAYPEANIKNIPLLITEDSKNMQFGDIIDIIYDNNKLNLIRNNIDNLNNHKPNALLYNAERHDKPSKTLKITKRSSLPTKI